MYIFFSKIFMFGHVEKVSLAGGHDDEVPRPTSVAGDDPTEALLQQAAQIDIQDDIVRQRADGIQNIHRDVNKIKDLFQDVAYHVTQQGDMLENIEANVSSAATRTSQGAQELVQADRRNRRNGSSIVCLSMLAIMFLVALAMLRDIFSHDFLKRPSGNSLEIIHI